MPKQTGNRLERHVHIDRQDIFYRPWLLCGWHGADYFGVGQNVALETVLESERFDMAAQDRITYANERLREAMKSYDEIVPGARGRYLKEAALSPKPFPPP